MNKSEKFNNDWLSGYITPEKIEKASEGFTQRTMVRLQSEKAPISIRKNSVKDYSIPLISVLITLAFIIAVLLSSSNDYLPDLSKLIPIIKISLPEFRMDKLFSFTIPELSIYISLGIFILFLFDQVLKRLFHRERK